MKWFKRKKHQSKSSTNRELWKNIDQQVYDITTEEKQNDEEYQTLSKIDNLIDSIDENFKTLNEEDIDNLSANYFPMRHMLKKVMTKCHQNLDHPGQNTIISVIVLLESQLENYLNLIQALNTIPHVTAYQPYGKIIKESVETLNHVAQAIRKSCDLILNNTTEEITTALLHRNAQNSNSELIQTLDKTAQATHKQIKQSRLMVSHVDNLIKDIDQQLKKEG